MQLSARNDVVTTGGEYLFNGDCVPDVGLARICLWWRERLVSFFAAQHAGVESLMRIGKV